MKQPSDLATLMPERDAEGYLIEPGDWNEEVAKVLAQGENVQLEDDHWDVIRFMRDYYDEHQIAVDARFVIKHLAKRMGKDAHKKLFELFPYGYVQQACKIAGMRRPRAWSTG
ncbi:MAG: TusE/DsrC/DsvC family sulfur relay protein [Thiobacillus sp.]|jgi:tRNA 2-thiouridine synthesizing protein E|uniref:TusE/DsrC/DsvC family sulfur relay protein n=1 Tax=Thiobacillus sp. TaxID=924 RepID=UPI0028947806|nr:TusE/DsrC/DsvC family sulfur relay protein [Thiobacillus sp.]MDT3705592.1 TusE/DsrC/DsvC family sulfur relay protein [Thiobacillus sp.]